MKKEKNKETDKKIQELEDKVKEAEEMRLRALADYQNLQRRTIKEKEELSYLLVASLIHQVIEVKEDLERFLENEKNEGIKSILDKLNSVLAERGVEELEVQPGNDFNPEFMEAITALEGKGDNKRNKVIELIQKGYKLEAGKVIRNAKVIVGK
ncbi:nucleotide exchange factor GrpE [Candidatus Dojkabacteria bacterium]|nr:nucleotide exchange factor GrpE [Candidatus Dojkabacteria bacterium]